MSGPVQAAAAKYVARGWAPVPIPYKKKAPIIKAWQKLEIGAADVPSYFNGKELNIGILLGESSGGLLDVDVDCDEALRLRKLLPITSCKFGRKSKLESHILYLVEGELPKTKKFTDPDGQCLIELRSTGAQTVFPPSVHPSGESIQFDEDGEPSQIPGSTLLGSVTLVACGSLLIRHWPVKGSRHELALAERAVRDATVTAPFAGLIARRYVNVGEFVTPGQQLFDLVALDPIEVEFHLPERDSSRVDLGAIVEVRVRIHSAAGTSGAESAGASDSPRSSAWIP